MNIKDLSSKKPMSDRPLPKVGTQGARLLHIVDVGIQPRKPFQGQEKAPCRKIWFNFELVQSLFDYNGRQVPHRIATADINASNDPKSALVKLLSGLDPADTAKGDLGLLLGKPYLVTVVHNKVGDRTYANFAGAMPAPDGFDLPQLSDKPGLFDYYKPDVDVLVSLPKWIREKIQSALNYKDSPTEKIWGQVQEEINRIVSEKEKEGVAF